MASQVVASNKQSNSLIVKLGKFRQTSLVSDGSKSISYQTQYLVVSNTVLEAAQAIQTHLPEVYQWGMAEAGSDDPSFIMMALMDSWDQYFVYYMGNDGTSGQGAVTMLHVYKDLGPANREVVWQWLIEQLDVRS
jgi:hypothetical protein